MHPSNESSGQKRALGAEIDQILNTNRAPLPFIWVSVEAQPLIKRLQHLIASCFCQESNPPCLSCQICRQVAGFNHPDLYHLSMSGNSAYSLKIDSIRNLQENIYRTAHQGSRRFVLIQDAEKLNQSSANALLKLLEEPPQDVVFFLVAAHLGTLPATLISRCQLRFFPVDANLFQQGPMAFGENDEKSSARGRLYVLRHHLMDQILHLSDPSYSVSVIAAPWNEHEFADLLWLFYLMVAEWIHSYWVDSSEPGDLTEGILRLKTRISVIDLFYFYDHLAVLQDKLSKNIAINPKLSLESIFIFLKQAMLKSNLG